MIKGMIATHEPHYNRISWSAIVIGALVGVGLGFLLNLYSLSIGLSIITTDTNEASIAIGGFIGLVIGSIAAMLVAGYTAGYLGRLYSPRQNLGILYGFATWTVALILAALIAGPVANYITNYSNLTPMVAAESQQTIDEQTETGVTESNQTQEQLTPTTLTWASFLAFLLFFIGALSCCVGAYWGMSQLIEEDEYHQ